MRDHEESEAREMMESIAAIFTILESHDQQMDSTDIMSSFIQELTHYRDGFNIFIEEQHRIKMLHDTMLNNSDMTWALINTFKKRQQVIGLEPTDELTAAIDILFNTFSQILKDAEHLMRPQPHDRRRISIDNDEFINRIDSLITTVNNLEGMVTDSTSFKSIEEIKISISQYKTSFISLSNVFNDLSSDIEHASISASTADKMLLKHKQQVKDTMDSVRNKVGAMAIFIWLFAIMFILLAQVLRSAQKKMETLTEDLRKANVESERKRMTLVSLFNSIPDALSVTDTQGLFQDANPTFEKLVGKSRCEIIGKTAKEIYGIHSDILAQTAKVEIEDTNRIELWIENPESKQKLLLDIISTPLIDPNQNICGSISLARDITERHQVQEALRQTKLEAETASQMKSDFLANMSHEIRTPMNAIIGMSQLALDTELTSKQRSYIEKLHFSAQSLLGIINDILDFSKVEAGKMELEKIDFHLEEVLENFGNIIGFGVKKKALELNFDMPTKLPTALIGDPLRLGQVLTNLGNNAVKFTHSGGEIVIGISVQQESTHDVTLQFSVKDNGIGMTVEQQGKLFQSFSQADTSTTRKYGGTGLGLAISKSFVNLMDGDIWVESEPDVGTVFFFTVKLGKQQLQIDYHQDVIDKIGRLKVLFVDDNATSRAIYGQMLESMNFTVSTEKCAATAITKIESLNHTNPYDLIIVDEDMSVIRGGEMLTAIRNNLNITNQPATILISALSDRTPEYDNAIGCILSKPGTPSSMLDAILISQGKGAVIENKYELRSKRFTQAKKQLQGTKLLLVEDNTLNQEVACELLSNNEVTVTIVENGAAALAALQVDNDFDGVLMDCQMPIMDGYETTRHIRKMHQYKLLPIIAMTANAMIGDREKVLSAGMNGHIAKPITIEDMFVTIAKWVKPQTLVEGNIDNKVTLAASKNLPQVPGIDCSIGLSHTMNNVTLYNKILEIYMQNNINFAADMASLFEQENWAELERETHNLKSNAGTIGAINIQILAEKLEQACHKQSPVAQDIFLELNLSLLPIVAGLKHYFEQSENTCFEHGDMDIVKINECAQKLKILLDDYDTEAVSIAEQLELLLVSTPMKADINKVLSAINGYDFDSAQLAFDKLNEKLTMISLSS
ncbi:response regulator [Shewanella sp. MEBiC00475]|uniref:hybrid sensor histidine kinase/response regulator n=1 Tax=Shewanella sp. MEBiC00475 TaxID=2575361 RepID=UPI0020C816A7|nr:response regulator [Shewanella sp. MEBiC00475]